MTPFQHFRLWVRRAPWAERLTASVAAIAVLAVLAWIVVPMANRSGSGATTPDSAFNNTAVSSPTAAGTLAAKGSGVTATTVAPGQLSSASGGAGGGTGTGAGAGAGGKAAGQVVSTGNATGGAVSGGCVSPPGAAQGITAGEIKIAITLVNIGGVAANSSFGVPPVSTQQNDYQAVIDGINKEGGVACRKLAPQYFQVDPADTADMQSKCLDVVQAKPFVELDFNGYASLGAACFAQHHMPFFGSYFMSQAKLSQGFPYVFDMDNYNNLYRNTVFGLQKLGFFGAGNGFKKLGWIYRSCDSDVIRDEKGFLSQVGVSGSTLVAYDAGCPSGGGGLVTPDVMEQAVLTFQRAGVTHVTTSEFTADLQSFTNVAQNQGFHPKYGLGDDAMIPVTYGNLHPNFQNMAGAVAIVDGRDGEEHTPGMTPDATTQKCDALVTARGEPPAYRQQVGASGLICDQLWMVAAAINHAPQLSTTALVAGLQRAGSVAFSYPQGPNNFAGNRVTTGGQFWRSAAFVSSCTCWQVTDKTFHHSFG